MSKFTGVIVGGLEIAAGAALLATGVGGGFGAMLIGAGAGTLIGALGTLLQKGPLAGSVSASRNPIAPWEINYGRVCHGGTLVYMNAWGSGNKYLDMIFVVGGTSMKGINGLRFEGKRIQLDTTATPSGVQPSTFPFINGGSSFTPVQQTIPIGTISRFNNTVTIALGANVPLLQVGDWVEVSGVRNIVVEDLQDVNGLWQVSNIVSQVFSSGSPPTSGTIVFQYTSPGADLSGYVIGGGVVKTQWPDYGRKIYMETLTGKQTLGETFWGMLQGTPKDGDPSTLIHPDVANWTSVCSLQGKSAVFLRLTYDQFYFSNGIPEISFLMYGKDDIYDPRNSPPTYGYTENAALIVADYLNQGYVDPFASPPITGVPQWGFGAAYGTEIPIPELINAANICDERISLAITIETLFSPSFDSEPRYACNGHFPLSVRRGEILANLLTSMAGRITYANGQFIIWPAAWYGGGITNVPTLRGRGALMGAFTTGVIPETQVISTMFIGKTATTFKAPPGTNYLQLGINGKVGLGDGQYNVQVTVNGVDFFPTVTANTINWNYPFNEHAPFQVSVNGGLPIENAIGFDQPQYVPCSGGDTVRVTYIGGLVQAQGLAAYTDADGDLANLAGGLGGSDERVPSHWTITYYPGDTFTIPTPLPVLAGPFTWVPKRKARDLFNGVKGKFVSPVNNWQPADFPPYCEDGRHGFIGSSALYENDIYLEQDGGIRIWKDIQLPFTISYAAAQRIACIELRRSRQQGTGTFRFNMWGYQLTVLDIMSVTFSFLGWTDKLLEVVKHRFLINEREDNGVKVIDLSTEVDVNESDPSVYAWDGFSQQLSPMGYQQSVMPSTAPNPDFVFTTLGMASGPKNSIIGADGVSRAAIALKWPKPTDGWMQQGGMVQARYTRTADLAQAFYAVPPTSPPTYFVPPPEADAVWVLIPDINPYVVEYKFDFELDSSSYVRVQMRTVNCAGVPSNWVDCINTELPHDPPFYTLLPHQTASRISPADALAVNGHL